MQTIRVLVAETGFVDLPFLLVKSYRRSDRRGRPAAASVELGIETFYKVYGVARPRQISSEEQGIVWDHKRFRTERMRRLFVKSAPARESERPGSAPRRAGDGEDDARKPDPPP